LKIYNKGEDMKVPLLGLKLQYAQIKDEII